jgi:2'-5' RNA ligase
MRLFIAIALSREIRDKLARVQSELRELEPGVNPVEPENIHLTLRFIGETVEDKLSELIRVISTVRDYPVFELELKSIGAFPSGQHPKVIWVGCADSDRAPEKIYRALEKELLNIGLPPNDHKFSAHITLGRNKSGKNIQGLAELINKYSGQVFGIQQVRQLSLFRSVLAPKGPIYTNIRDFSLKK